MTRRSIALLKQFSDLIMLATIWDAITLTLVYRSFGSEGVVTSLVFEVAGALLIVAAARRYNFGFLLVTETVDPDFTLFKSEYKADEESEESDEAEYTDNESDF